MSLIIHPSLSNILEGEGECAGGGGSKSSDRSNFQRKRPSIFATPIWPCFATLTSITIPIDLIDLEPNSSTHPFCENLHNPINLTYLLLQQKPSFKAHLHTTAVSDSLCNPLRQGGHNSLPSLRIQGPIQGPPKSRASSRDRV